MSALQRFCALALLLNTSVDAKNAKKEYQGRKESKEDLFFFSLRSWLFSFANFASTLAFNPPTQIANQRGTP
jgi:hypothetical protein